MVPITKKNIYRISADMLKEFEMFCFVVEVPAIIL